MATAAKRKSKAMMRAEIVNWLGMGAAANPRFKTGRAICDELVAEGLAYKEDDGYWATESLRLAKSATKMGAESTPSRSRQVAARPHSKGNLETYSGRLGAALRKRRQELEISVADVVEAVQADGFDVQANAVYHWEKGLRPIPLNAVPTLAKLLKTSIRELLPAK